MKPQITGAPHAYFRVQRPEVPGIAYVKLTSMSIKSQDHDDINSQEKVFEKTKITDA